MVLRSTAFLTLLSLGAIFGFFYAWVCSTMWGLDAIDPRVAITAMQGMNASVRNEVFALSFFGTPAYAALTVTVALMAGRKDVAVLFGAAGALYLGGGMILTMTQNVPMNEALALHTQELSLIEAREIWAAYSPRWQMFNVMRTIFCGVAFLLAGLGLYRLGASGKVV